MATIFPFARPIYVMLKPAGPRCNLRCRYCYYTEKSGLYAPGVSDNMSDEMLELFVRQYLEAQTTPEVLFTWHGGEPMLRPIAFYRRALALQRRYARNRHVDNCLQTNGTLITEDWCRFFRDEGFLVGVSIDGPRDMHDAMRGHTFDKVMRGIELLCRHGVEWNAMATVNSLNASRPVAFYRFFRSIDCRYLQFTPVVERIAADGSDRLLAGTEDGGSLTPESVSSAQWGEFACAVFDEWIKADVGQVFVQLFDATLANWVGVAPGVCSLAPECGQAAVMEADGTLYSCDHFVFPQYRLGNIRRDSVTAMMYGRAQTAFGQAKRTLLPRQCRECQWLFACNGECPRNRFDRDRYGNPGFNYLCRGYSRYFSHVAPYMDFMKAELDAGRAPANVMGRVTDGGA